MGGRRLKSIFWRFQTTFGRKPHWDRDLNRCRCRCRFVAVIPPRLREDRLRRESIFEIQKLFFKSRFLKFTMDSRFRGNDEFNDISYLKLSMFTERWAVAV